MWAFARMREPHFFDLTHEIVISTEAKKIATLRPQNTQ